MILDVFRYFVRAVYASLPWFETSDVRLSIASRALQGKSFRVDDADNTGITTLYRFWFRALRASSVNREACKKSTEPKTIAVIDAGAESMESRQYYINHFAGITDAHFIFRDNALVFSSEWKRIKQLMVAFLYATAILPVFLIKKSRRGALAITVSEFLEHIYFLSALKRCKVRQIYMFCIYEKDTNLLYLLLKKAGLYVSKISSDGPVSLWNKNLISDEIIVSFPYQMEEIAFHKASIIAEKVILWGPETIKQTAGLYEDEEQRKIKSPMSIGFYSTASWVRSLKNQTARAVTNPENEIRILNWLNEYLKEKENVFLYVYLHPKEKHPEFQQKVHLHYGEFLKTNNWHFADVQKPTSACFNEVQIGVGYYSTVLLERDYYGFPTMLSPLGMDDFPVSGTALAQKCVFNKTDFIAGLNKVLN